MQLYHFQYSFQDDCEKEKSLKNKNGDLYGTRPGNGMCFPGNSFPPTFWGPKLILMAAPNHIELWEI